MSNYCIEEWDHGRWLVLNKTSGDGYLVDLSDDHNPRCGCKDSYYRVDKPARCKHLKMVRAHIKGFIYPEVPGF
jgi:hypothetical protein